MRARARTGSTGFQMSPSRLREVPTITASAIASTAGSEASVTPLATMTGVPGAAARTCATYTTFPVEDYDLWVAGLMLAIPGLATVAMMRLASSPFGSTLRAIRDDELAAAAVGKR